MITWKQVQSSNLVAVAEDHGYLYVMFNNGTAYRYKDTAAQMKPLLESESEGRYFHQHIKNRPFEKLCSVCMENLPVSNGMCATCMDNHNKGLHQ